MLFPCRFVSHFAFFFRVLEEGKSPTDSSAALNKHVLWSLVISSSCVPVLHVQTLPPSLPGAEHCCKPAVASPALCLQPTRAIFPKLLPLAGPGKTFVSFPQALVGALPPIFAGTHQTWVCCRGSLSTFLQLCPSHPDPQRLLPCHCGQQVKLLISKLHLGAPAMCTFVCQTACLKLGSKECFS